ncbi:MAG: Gfo/Idh/MocA family oxidoreductase [Acidobacteria bacterium]|nr:Gfo/Idh/MocA family oxidoreductase [Acidobacteriota bacterium]
MLVNSRRSFVALAGLSLAAASKRYRVAVIGHTGRGNYGHGIDTVWRAFDNMDLVAIADADEAGRLAAAKRTGATRAYSDYREMLRKEKPGIVGIGPRWTDQRVAMVSAAAEAGAHIYMEKPFAENLADADRIVAAVRHNNVKLQIAHQMRTSPFALKAKSLIEAGEIGEIQEIRSRGKEDKRAGGEDMMVLGSHLFDMMRFFLGNPEWTTAHVTTNGREIGKGDVTQPTENIGPVAGKQISAIFAFAGGVHGYFSSRAVADTHPLRFGTWIYGSRGVIFLPNGIYPDGGLHILRSPAWLPDAKHSWEAIPATPDPGIHTGPEIANALMVADLLRAIEGNSKPCCNEEDGRWSIAMIDSVYAAQKSGQRVALYNYRDKEQVSR